MGIAAAIGGIGAAATVANTINNLAGGSGGSAVGQIGSAVGTLANAAAYQQAGAAISGSAQTALTQQEGATAAETNALLPSVQALPPVASGLTNLLGAGPQGPAGELAALQATPGYQFSLTQGLQATQSGLSAQGLADSGSAVKGAAQYAEGLAGNTYQGIVSNYMNSVNTLQSGASNYGQIYQNAQNAENNLNLDIGQGQAYGLTGMANALNAGLQTQQQPLTTAPSGSPNYGPNYSPGQTNPMTAPQTAALQGNTNEQYGTNAQALQNPYQITAPQPNYNPVGIDPNSLGATPTLPTG